MYWQIPGFLWVEILPGLILLAWVVSEVRRMHRLRVFGDPRIMGLTVPWLPRIAALFMLIFGVACAAAVIPLPAMPERATATDASLTDILVDVRSLDNAGERMWDAFDSAIQTLVGLVPGTRFSAIALSTPPKVLVYPTADTQGLEIVSARLRFNMPPGNRAELAQAMSGYAASRKGKPRAARSVIVTAWPADQLESVGASLHGIGSDIVFAELSAGDQPVRYGHRNAAGEMVWTVRSQDLPQLFKGNQPEPGRRTFLAPIQWFALMAVIVLCGEYILSLSGRTRAGRMPNV